MSETEVCDILWEFAGKTALEKARAAVEQVKWLRMQLRISETNEGAALTVASQNAEEMSRAREVFKRWYANSPTREESRHESEARQADGASSPVQERKEA